MRSYRTDPGDSGTARSPGPLGNDTPGPLVARLGAGGSIPAATIVSGVAKPPTGMRVVEIVFYCGHVFRASDVIVFQKGLYTTRTTHVDALSGPACGPWCR